MKKPIKYIYDCNPFYIRFKKHFCPKCGERLELRYNSKVVNSKSPEAKKYDFTLGDTFLVGDVEFRTSYFHCVNCQLDVSCKKMNRRKKKRPIEGRDQSGDGL